LFYNLLYKLQYYNSDKNGKTLENCARKMMVGLMLPGENVSGDYDNARCVGMQKQVGF